MEFLNEIRSAFWSEYVWLPPNTTWAIYARKANGIQYAQYNDLYYSLITAIVLLLIRFTLERYLYTPIGIKLGLKPFRSKQAQPNDVLERAFVNSKSRFTEKQIIGYAKQLDWSVNRVQRWYRLRLKQDKPTTLVRFCESLWRMTFYTFSFLYGAWCLYDKPWIYDSIHCFINYPHHSVSTEVWWYYNLELGFYLSLVVSQFFDIKRKDFWQMFIHHIVTVLLLAFSWTCNFHRIGSLVLVIHDFADIPLDGAKIFRYLKMQRVSNIVFTIFALAWIFSRIGLFPYRIIAYSSYYALDVVEMFPAYYIFNSLLCSLQVLHIIWTALILKIGYDGITKDGFKDIRESDDSGTSSSEESSSSDEQIKNDS